MNWTQATEDFCIYLKLERGLAQNTILAYKRDLQKLASWCEEKEVLPLTATDLQLRSAIQYFSGNGLASTSQSRFISTIRAFYKYLLFEEYLDQDPSELLEAPRTARKLPDVLSENEIDRIIGAIDLSDENGERNRAILEILYGCGLRVSELINLSISNLFLEQKLLRIYGKGNKERIVPINAQAIKYLNIYKNEVRIFMSIKKGEEDMLFLNRRGKRLSRVMIFTIIKNLTEKAGIRKKVSPHTFRHSFASHMVNRGADIRAVQELLGHANIVTTEIYTHLDKSQIQKTFLKYHPRAIAEQ